MADVRWDRYPYVARNEMARTWLRIGANLGLASNTIDAYGRALQDYLVFSSKSRSDITTANREHVAAYVHDLRVRPIPRRTRQVASDAVAGLANATMQQRLTAIRLFYDYLIEEGRRTSNPVGRAGTHLDDVSAVPGSVVSSRAIRSFPGFPTTNSGGPSSRRLSESPCGIA